MHMFLCIFVSTCCLHILHRSKHRYNSGTQINAVTWQAVHKHVLADAFRSKKNSSVLLVHEQQASQK